MKALNRKNAGIFLGVLAVLMAVFAFADLPVSMALFNMESTFGNLFAAFGEFPFNAIAVFSATALLATRSREVKWKSIVGLVVYGLVAIVFTAAVIAMPLHYIPISIPLMAVLGIAILVFCIVATRRIAKTHHQQLRAAAIISIFTVLTSLLVFNVIKQFWGRQRMYTMADPASEFTPWYLPQGISASDDFKSFPSGHSANAAGILCITLLPTFVDTLKGKEIPLYIVAGVWTVLVMVSRVVMGAHFASDVTMGAALTIVGFFIIRGLVTSYYAKNDPLAARLTA